MLLRDFAIQPISQSPDLFATLTVADFKHFSWLASKVKYHVSTSLHLTPTQIPLLPCPNAALSPQFPDNLLDDLWPISFPFLPQCRINATAIIHKFGLQFGHPTKLLDEFLCAPLSHCIVCLQNNSNTLHIHLHINGYLHNTDGVHTVQTLILSYLSLVITPMISFDSTTRKQWVAIKNLNCHYYMSTRLACMVRVLQMLGHVSHFAVVNWYNLIFVNDTPPAKFTPGHSFMASMSEEECWNGLMLVL
ncbi:hypothetical protein DFH28DRAFT_921358 [Melampsora americana]|nr:hypothetical protein DFH28DRAFT_921358 [Melampsora americana]